MPTSTYDLIASNVLTSSASSVTFSSIPATYRDLVLVVTLVASTNSTALVRFNSDSGSNYSYVRMQGNGSTATSASGSSLTSLWEQGADENPNQYLLQIMDYSATDKHKTVLTRHNRPAAAVWGLASRWANNSAITSISFAAASGTYNSGSSWYLYGIVS